MDISGRLAQANGRLESASLGVRIKQRGDRLLLRATLPPKPGSAGKGMHQQLLSIGVRANPAGLKEAELEARKIGVLLESSNFDWTPYLKTANSTPITCANWIDRFQQHYLIRQFKSEVHHCLIYWHRLPRKAFYSQVIFSVCC